MLIYPSNISFYFFRQMLRVFVRRKLDGRCYLCYALWSRPIARALEYERVRCKRPFYIPHKLKIHPQYLDHRSSTSTGDPHGFLQIIPILINLTCGSQAIILSMKIKNYFLLTQDANQNINFHRANEIDWDTITKIIRANFRSLSFNRTDKVLPIFRYRQSTTALKSTSY